MGAHSSVVEQVTHNHLVGGPNPSGPRLVGRLAQLVRALRSHRKGHRFESCIAHQTKKRVKIGYIGPKVTN